MSSNTLERHEAVTRRRPGRPRDEGHDGRIIDAVLDLVDADAPVTLRAVVERSGVSRAAIYRRWPSLTDLVAEALNRGRVRPVLEARYRDPEELVSALLSEAKSLKDTEGQRRVKARLIMGLRDRDFQRISWERHVSRRRDPMRQVIEAGKADGVFRADVDTEACCDLLASVFYYQVVVRGDRDLEAAERRVEAALRTVVAGMRADVGR